MVPSSPSKTLVLKDKLKPLPCVKRDLLKMLTTPFFSQLLSSHQGPRDVTTSFSLRGQAQSSSCISSL